MSFLFKIHFIFVLIFYFFFEAQVVARNRLRKTKRTQDEYSEVVLNKKYPKKNKIEISVPTIGYIFNQSYINSIMLQGAISQYRNEEWGLSLDVAKFINEDKYERYCLERFYNDFLFKLDQFSTMKYSTVSFNPWTKSTCDCHLSSRRAFVASEKFLLTSPCLAIEFCILRLSIPNCFLKLMMNS